MTVAPRWSHLIHGVQPWTALDVSRFRPTPDIVRNGTTATLTRLVPSDTEDGLDAGGVPPVPGVGFGDWGLPEDRP